MAVDDEDGGRLMVAAALNGCDDGRLQGGGKAAARQWGQRGRHRHINQTEAAAATGGGSQWQQQAAMATGGYGNMRQWQTVAVAAALVAAVVTGGYRYGARVGGAKTLKLLHFKSFFYQSSLANFHVRDA